MKLKPRKSYEVLSKIFLELLQTFAEIDWKSPINLNLEALQG